MNLWTWAVRPSKPVLQRDASGDPSVLCYGQCSKASTVCRSPPLPLLMVIIDNAYLEAQAVGKTPELCKRESTFQVYSEACRLCLESNSDPGAPLEDQFPELNQYIEYCSAIDATGPSTVTATEETEVTGSIESINSTTASTRSLQPHATITTTFFQETTVNGIKTSLLSTLTFESFEPIPETATIEITVQDSTGGPSLLTVLTNYIPLPSTYLQQHSTTTVSQGAPSCKPPGPH